MYKFVVMSTNGSVVKQMFEAKSMHLEDGGVVFYNADGLVSGYIALNPGEMVVRQDALVKE